MSFLRVNLSKIEENFLSVKKAVGGVEVYCVVKSDGYGCGLEAVSKVLDGAGADGFVVADVKEGVALRDAGIRQPVLVLGSDFCRLTDEVVDRDLTLSVFNADCLTAVTKNVAKGKKLKVWVKLNTGFNRLGFNADDLSNGEISAALLSEKIEITGIFSHLRGTGEEYGRYQYEVFLRLVDVLRVHGVRKNARLSLLNSNGIKLGLPTLDIVRTGAALYGLYGEKQPDLYEEKAVVAEFFARVLQINTVRAGDGLGYDESFLPQIDTRVAVLDVGYANGLPRRADKKGLFVLIDGHRCPFVGSVCMNHSFVALPFGVKSAESAEIFGKRLPLSYVAKRLETLDYEVLCRFGGATERAYS